MEKTKSTALLLLFIVFFTASCGNPENQNNPKPNAKSAPPNTEIRSRIDGINRLLETAMLEGRYEEMFDYYADNIIVAPGLGPVLRGKNAVVEGHRDNKKWEVKYHSFNAKAEEIWEEEKTVFERGTFGMSYSYKNNPRPKAYAGSYFTVWEKSSRDSLLIKYVIWNLNFNPCD